MRTVKIIVAILTGLQCALILVPPHHSLAWWYQASLLATVAVLFGVEAADTPRRMPRLTQAQKEQVYNEFIQELQKPWRKEAHDE
jgi:hypothetical protein